MLTSRPAYRDSALGFLEVRGLAVAIESADAMLKCADVRLLRQLRRDPAQITLVVEGSLGACAAAVEAGKHCADRFGALISAHVIGRPDEDTGKLILRLIECDAGSAQSLSHADTAPVTGQPMEEAQAEIDSGQLLQVIASLSGACGAPILAARLGKSPEAIQARLDALCADGMLLKKRGRYLLPQPREDDK